VMHCAGDQQHAPRSRALIVLLWRAGLRISEALSLAESDLNSSRGSVLVRCGKGGKRREVGMDQWAWQHLNSWLEIRVGLRVGALLCVIDGLTHGRPWSPTAARATLRQLAGIPGRAAISPAYPTRQPRDHVNLPPWDRQQRDHRHRPPPPRSDAPSQRRTSLTEVVQRGRTGAPLVSGASGSVSGTTATRGLYATCFAATPLPSTQPPSPSAKGVMGRPGVRPQKRVQMRYHEQRDPEGRRRLGGLQTDPAVTSGRSRLESRKVFLTDGTGPRRQRGAISRARRSPAVAAFM
jgi:hypothetical protein